MNSTVWNIQWLPNRLLSSTTLRNGPKNAGYRSIRSVKRQILSPRCMAEKLQWCRARSRIWRLGEECIALL